MAGELEARLSARTASAEGELARVLGEQALRPTVGCLHVCSCVEAEAGALRAIRVGPAAPKSELDGFVLRAARAQADAIITSGGILRSEPELRHLPGRDPVGRALSRYRRALGLRAVPRTVVLSGSGDLPAHHPLWTEGGGALVWTAPERVEPLRAALPVDVEVHGAVDRRPAALLVWLRSRGLTRLDLEVGPSAVAAFYGDGLVDSLWCARALDPSQVAEAARGGPWPFDAAQIEAWRVAGSGPVDQDSGPWRFDHCRPAVSR